MALTFITGSSGAGKTTALLQKVIRESMENPKQRFYVIVPEQATMQTQKDLVRLHPRHSILNIDVLSFNRLAYRVFSEVGYRKTQLLEEIGKTFLLEKIALEQQDHLRYFGGTLARPENLSEMKGVLSELMLYGDSPEDLERAVQQEDHGNQEAGNGMFRMKMQDITLVYNEFLKKMEGSLMTAEEVPDKLCEVVGQSEKLKGCVLTFDGFTGFTPVQLHLLEKLMPIAKEICVTVTMDQNEDLYASKSSPQNIFHMSHATCRSLIEIAQRTGTRILPEVRIDHPESARHRNSRELQFLEKNIMRRGIRKWKQKPEDIRIFDLENPRREIEEAALLIHRLVRRDGLRFRDIAIVTGDLETYSVYVRRIFGMWKIPYFLDEKRSLLTNPFLEYIRAALEVCADNYSYEGIFRLLKSGMTDLDADSIEHLENYVLGTGIRGRKKWRETFVKTYLNEDPGEVPKLNEVREKVCELLDPLADAFSKRGSTVREKTVALYEFCVRSRAEEKLSQKQEEFEAKGQPDLAREYAQVYPYVMNFLDKLVDVLGDEKISMSDYRDLIEAGFSEARIAIIPPGADRVLVGDMERSRLGRIKAMIFVGVNDGLVPKPQSSGGMLSDADRKKLQEQKLSLKPTAREAMAIERFYLYLTLTKPEQKLYLFYSRANAKGESLRPAFLIGLIKRMFPLLEEESSETGSRMADETQEKDPDRQKESDLQNRIEIPETGVSLLLEGLQKINEENPGPAFLELFSYYRNQPEYAPRMQSLLEAAGMHKPSGQIGSAAAKALYGRHLQNSASRLERFCECEFRHFLQYGLRLKPRPEFSFSGMDRGTILHEALQRYSDRVRSEHTTWAEAAKDEKKRAAYAKDALEKSVRNNGGDVLYDSARNEYEIHRMERLLDTSIARLGEQLAAGDFDVTWTEADFQDSGGLLNFRFPDGTSMALTGRIDRVDTCESDDGMTYVKVIDYKTGNVVFDINQVYYGLQLQLVLYLNEAVEKLKKEQRNPVPAGIFYYQVKDPIVEVAPGDTIEDIEKKILDKLKVSGVVLKDPEAIGHLDRSLKGQEGSSRFIPVSYRKGKIDKKTGEKIPGAMSSTSKVMDAASFQTMEEYVLRKMRECAWEILHGEADINPYRYKKTVACAFCPFSGICGFDRRIRGFQYRELLPMKQDEALKKMEEDTDEDAELDGRTKKGH